VTSIPLSQVGNWRTTDSTIEHEFGQYFKVIAAQVEINNREVKTWCQPLIAPLQQGLTAFVVKKINGTYHFLVQGKVESGNFDIIEMAPTVQCITDNYIGKNNQPFVEYVLHARPEQIKIDTLQSEEGGRFYQEQNRNMIIEADDSFPIDDIPENYIWVSFQQLMLFLHFNNYLNIQSRSLISLIRFC
jgi:oxidase EvaA